MKEKIYDADKYIDFETIEILLKKNADKKIICFGGGTAADIFARKVLHGTEIRGVLVKSPEILTKLEKGSFIILILSKHFKAISRQLKEYGLQESIDFFNLYRNFFEYFRIKKYEDNARCFLEFIKRIPDNTFDNIPLKENQSKIGIVCLGEMLQNITWYAMAQSVLLRYNGYASTLIIDTMKSFDSYIYFDGIEDVARIYIDYVLKYLLEKCPDIDVKYVDAYGEAELSKKDNQMTEKYAPLVVKWFDSQKDEVFLSNNPRRVEYAKCILKATMKNIKKFFEMNEFDTINVYTGIHRHRCVYTYIGCDKDIRVSTYDADKAMGGITLYETDGVSGNSPDIVKLIRGNYFNDVDKKEIIELARKDLHKRMNSSVDDEGYNYQPALYDKVIKKYDIIIPLNISWDSAALGIDRVFGDEVEWLKETLDFLMKKTTMSVMIREHPAQAIYNEFVYKDYTKEISIINEYKDRIFFANADSEVNTYQYLNKCRLVLPYSSTIGIESVLLGKNVILHTDVYYAKLGVAYQATTKKEYFDKILLFCNSTEENYDCNIENAYLAYYCQMNHYFKCEFIECLTGWMKKNIQELNKIEGVRKIIGIIAEDKIAIYENIKEKIESKEK